MDRLTAAQVRAARGMSNWSMLDLARAAGVSVSTVKRVENGGAGVSPGTVGRVQSAFEATGVQFLPDEGTGPGVRRKSCQALPASRLP